MFIDKLKRWTLWIQGTYTFITAVWPIVHTESFMEVSGYKNDIWLLKTVSVLLLCIALCLLISIYDKEAHFSVGVLALTTAIVLAYVDFYYVLTNTIPPIYLADGVVEIIFALSWLLILIKRKQPGN